MKMVRTIAFLIAVLLMSSCQQKQPLKSPVVVTDVKRIVSPETALVTARAYLDSNKVDLSRYDMTEPEEIQEVQIRGQKAWRVSWRLRDFTGKGGQLVVTVGESGKCEQGWGE